MKNINYEFTGSAGEYAKQEEKKEFAKHTLRIEKPVYEYLKEDAKNLDMSFNKVCQKAFEFWVISREKEKSIN